MTTNHFALDFWASKKVLPILRYADTSTKIPDVTFIHSSFGRDESESVKAWVCTQGHVSYRSPRFGLRTYWWDMVSVDADGGVSRRPYDMDDFVMYQNNKGFVHNNGAYLKGYHSFKKRNGDIAESWLGLHAIRGEGAEIKITTPTGGVVSVAIGTECLVGHSVNSPNKAEVYTLVDIVDNDIVVIAPGGAEITMPLIMFRVCKPCDAAAIRDYHNNMTRRVNEMNRALVPKFRINDKCVYENEVCRVSRVHTFDGIVWLVLDYNEGFTVANQDDVIIADEAAILAAQMEKVKTVFRERVTRQVREELRGATQTVGALSAKLVAAIRERDGLVKKLNSDDGLGEAYVALMDNLAECEKNAQVETARVDWGQCLVEVITKPLFIKTFLYNGHNGVDVTSVYAEYGAAPYLMGRYKLTYNLVDGAVRADNIDKNNLPWILEFQHPHVGSYICWGSGETGVIQARAKMDIVTIVEAFIELIEVAIQGTAFDDLMECIELPLSPYAASKILDGEALPDNFMKEVGAFKPLSERPEYIALMSSPKESDSSDETMTATEMSLRAVGLGMVNPDHLPSFTPYLDTIPAAFSISNATSDSINDDYS